LIAALDSTVVDEVATVAGTSIVFCANPAAHSMIKNK
jgi:hypothetical protein